MEKYKYCNIGPASSPRIGGREGGKERGREKDVKLKGGTRHRDKIYERVEIFLSSRYVCIIENFKSHSQLYFF